MAGNVKKGKKPGRQAMSEEAKAAQKEKLAGETKAAKFIRLGNPRVTKAIRTIKLVGNLSGSGYEYSQAQIDKITALLKGAVSETMERFNVKEKSGKGPSI